MDSIELAASNFRAIRAAFLACGQEALTVRQMFGLRDGQPTSVKCHIMVKRLVDTGHLDRVVKEPPYQHVVTAKGWKLFEQFDVGQIGVEFIYRVLAREEAKVAMGVKPRQQGVAKSGRTQLDCKVCGGQIVDRKTYATKCWGCEMPSRRVRFGGDDHPRTRAYYEMVGPKRARAERKRLRERAAGQADPHVETAALATPPKEPYQHRPFGTVVPAPAPHYGLPDREGQALADFAREFGGATGMLAERLQDVINRMMLEQTAAIDKLRAQLDHEITSLQRRVGQMEGARQPDVLAQIKQLLNGRS